MSDSCSGDAGTGDAGTGDPCSLENLSVTVPRREVLRYLGYPRGHQPAARIEGVLAQRWAQAEALLEPRGAYRVINREQATEIGMPRPTENVAVALCTIGSALEQEAQRLTGSNELLGGLVLDAFGSAATEACADALSQLVCLAACELGRHARVRISPGYGRWNVRHQKALLTLLPAQSLEVHLTEGMMMIPRKSVSFAVRLEEQPSAGQRIRCSRCDLDHCDYREGGDGRTVSK